MTVAFNMLLEEREGLRRSIVLRGRSLPFKGVSFPSRQRVDITYPGGNPVAHSQVNGPVWMDTTMGGKWSDIHLWDDQSAATLVNFPSLQSQAQPRGRQVAGNTFSSGNTVPSQFARTARALRDAMYRMSRSGSLIRLEWGSIVRYGFIEEFDPSHDGEEDIRWDLLFKPTGDTESQPVPRPQGVDLTSMLQKIIEKIKSILDALKNPIFLAEEWRRRLTGYVTLLGSFIEELLGTLERIANYALSPLELFGTLKSTFIGIKLAVNNTLSTFADVSAALLAAVRLDASEVSYANAVQASTRRLLIELAAECRIAIDATEEMNAPLIRTIRTVAHGETLRDIALSEYNSAASWRLIADFNGFESSVVPSGTLVRVPQV